MNKKSYILSTQRNDFGKKVRKKYEQHKVSYHWNDLREWILKLDGISNTISTIFKDNLVIEFIK